jgi:hypothetical protein
MAKLYIANCSKAEHLFNYFLPENPRPFIQHIRAGTQSFIEGTEDVIKRIIDQHAPYGFQEVSKCGKGFGGQCYRIDKPISVEAIEAGLSQDAQERIDRATESRKYTAAAVDGMMAGKAQEMGLRQTSPAEFEITEQTKGPTDNAAKFSETIEVVRDGLQPSNKGKRGKSR